MNTRRVTADEFEYALNDMLNEIFEKTEKGIEPAVKSSTRLARRKTKANIEPSGIETRHPNDGYASGWASRVKRETHGAAGTVYNKRKPGLAHLLEKGHAKQGGGRVAGHAHIAPAADDAFKDFEKRINQLLDTL